MATLITNTLQPMPIYNSAAEWWQNARRGNGPCRHTIVTKSGMIPFYLTTDYVKSSSVVINMIKVGEATASYVLTNNATITMVGNVDGMKSYYVTFNTMTFSEGLYYLEIVWSPVKKFYSDVFSVQNAEKLMKIDYLHTQSIALQDGRVLMFGQTAYPLQMWLRPEGGNILTDWQTEETVDARDGYQMVERRDMWRQHSITFLANERTVDALMMMWICDTMTITYDGETYKVDYMESPSSVKVESQNLREVTLTWRTDMVVQVNGTV